MRKVGKVLARRRRDRSSKKIVDVPVHQKKGTRCKRVEEAISGMPQRQRRTDQNLKIERIFKMNA